MGLSNPIFVALDVPTLAHARALALELAPHVGGFKVGLELLHAEGTPHVLASLRDCGRPIFLDGKFHDIPNTVASAVRVIAKCGAVWCNVHALGGAEMMRAAVDSAGDTTKILAVTLLTSMNIATATQIGLSSVQDDAGLRAQVVALARLAQECGCVGVVASPQETAAIRAACGEDFLIVTPGVRPTWAAANDQARVMTPREAHAAGASALVIGRPITNPPTQFASPAAAAQAIVAELTQ